MRDSWKSDLMCIYTSVVSATIPHITMQKDDAQEKNIPKILKMGPLNAGLTIIVENFIVLTEAKTYNCCTP